MVAALAAASLILPSGLGTAAQRTSPPSLKSLIARAKQLQNQINALSEQYDGLRIQLTQARQAEHLSPPRQRAETLTHSARARSR